MICRNFKNDNSAYPFCSKMPFTYQPSPQGSSNSDRFIPAPLGDQKGVKTIENEVHDLNEKSFIVARKGFTQRSQSHFLFISLSGKQ